MKLNGVEMIPTSVVSCFINREEVRILELAMEGFSFRTSNRIEQITEIQLYYLMFQASHYELLLLCSFEVIEEQKEAFYYIYTIKTEDENFHRLTSFIIRDYSEYISLKLSGDDVYLSSEKVGYPTQECYYNDFDEQKNAIFDQLNWSDSKSNLFQDFELAISIDQPKRYQQYLDMEWLNYVSSYFADNYLASHALAKKSVKRIYIGNQFCHNLLPSTELLLRMLEKAEQDQLDVTLAYTYMREDLIALMEHQITEVYTWCQTKNRKIELIVNDWGMVSLLQDKTDYIKLNFGTLLNKRRKDPRYGYKKGFDQDKRQLEQNSTNSEEFRDYLLEHNQIKRYEYESCGYRMLIPGKHHSLHLPYYQTNTSQYCTLYAKCTFHDRGKQQYVRNCPRYCEEFFFSYPSHLGMVGKYNSIFGIDDTLLKDVNELRYYLESGIDRIVLNCL